MLLNIKELEVSYGRIRALTGTSIAMEANIIGAVVGPNGAGKTSLLSCISGLIPPQAGQILFNGKSITGLSPHAVVREGISHVPQGRRLFSDLSVTDNLLLGSYLQSNRQIVRDQLEEMLNLFPILRDRSGQRAGTLSGGEQQMLAIARALMSKPQLIMLDEPTLGLAPMIVDKVIQTILDIKSHGISVLIAEQDAHMAFSVADQVWVMEIGGVALCGTPEGLASNPHVQEAYLGS